MSRNSSAHEAEKESARNGQMSKKPLHFSGISGIQITQYLTWLRNDYRTQYGKPLAEKSIKHHYNILSFIFGYAEKQDLIEKNPMKKVDAPKVRRRAVDALSEEDARRFFEELNALDFDFRCILQLLITTGLRRGECIGLQWQDVDFDRVAPAFRFCLSNSTLTQAIPIRNSFFLSVTHHCNTYRSL